MTIKTGDTLPEATFLRLGASGPESVALSDLTQGRKVVIFALPGAYTATCTTAHVPSFIRTAGPLAAKGVEEIICITVNDPFVVAAWSRETGADAAGITMLADSEGLFTEAVGMLFDAPAIGLIGRSKRYAMLVEDGVVTVMHEETARGGCEISGGEAMLDAI